MKEMVLLALLLTVSPVGYSINDLEAGFLTREKPELRREIKSKYKTRPGYLYEYERNKYYSLSKTGSAVGSYDLNDAGSQLKGWGIKRWPHLQVPPEINFAPGMTQNRQPTLRPRSPSTGCLTQSPLRYGDLEGDGSNEVFLVLDDELIVFSPEYERIVFAMFIDASDWWQWDDHDWLRLYKEDHNGNTPPLEDQYHGNSHSWLGSAVQGRFEPGVRAYSKLFTGDFDQDGNPDLIKWEKVYISNKKTESIAWNKVRNSLTHYERDLATQKRLENGVTGEYLPQITLDVVIEGWLRENELTWQQGFPSFSECPREEGKLIPEIHDPLLNDPDVLR
ncbi:hypothetical protein GCM10011297_35090 [Bacterioplanes sanyensis]|uniref:hypothetical protein n=1 Tax=Bacterioplanes sanyensis TaxID=1249553 RepID=UPI00167AFE4F|nr:hypothetical protein [Bacterioplanes sanyensis]GGY59564.1 hypothetical protein GCM10011297_35090 [Bacterioplanes sanyensis]